MGSPLPSPKGGEAPKFSAHVYCGQTAGWIKILLGTEVGLSPGNFVLDGHPAPILPKGGGAKPPPQYSADFYCGQTVGCIKMPLRMDRPQPRGLCVRWGPSPPKFSAKFNCLLLYYCYCYFVRTLHSHYWFVQV